LDLCFFLQASSLLHHLQHLLGLVDVPLAPELLCPGQQLPDLLVQLVDTFSLLQQERQREENVYSYTLCTDS